MIALEPMVLCITLYNSFTCELPTFIGEILADSICASLDGILYLLFTAVPIIFQIDKGWTPVQASLPFLSVVDLLPREEAGY